MKETIVYLDYASTALRDPEILKNTHNFALTHYANVWRGLYTRAEEAEEWYRTSKKTVAKWIGCEPVEVLYTYSATYAMNLITLALEHNQILEQGDTILLSQSEHHANIVPWQILAKRVWAVIKFVHLDNQYHIDMEHLKSLLDETVKVVSLQYASNVTGAVHHLEEVRALIGNERLFFIDATQMAMHGPLNMQRLWANGMVFSGHKMMADTGIGVLALWRTLQKAWKCPVGGGGAINFVSETSHEQAGIPEKWEPGTPHITGAVSLHYAIQHLSCIPSKKHEEHKKLIQYTQSRFKSLEQQGIIRLFHTDTPAGLGIWSFVVAGKHNNDIADALDWYNICVRGGHHCCDPLHQLWWVTGTVRVSIGLKTTQEEIDYFFESLQKIIAS